MSDKKGFPCEFDPRMPSCDPDGHGFLLHTCGKVKAAEFQGGLTDPRPMQPGDYVVKDSGKRMKFDSGMQRDTTEGKWNFSLALDGPMFLRWVIHLTKGAVKYAKRNWMKANGPEELERFRESAVRHFFQWYNGDTDEDHAAAVYFNINGAEYVKEKLNARENSQAPETISSEDRGTAGGPDAV